MPMREMLRAWPYVRSIGCSTIHAPTRERICFIHVPKCGGTSYDLAMRGCVGIGQRLMGAVGHLEPAAATLAADNLREDRGAFRDRLLAYELCRKRVRYLSGHFRFPMHAGKEMIGDWQFVTVFREPVDRWLSLYFYNRNKQSNHSRTELDLRDYVETERARGSGQAFVRAFGDPELEDMDARVASAQDNLDRFAVVGLLDDPQGFRARFEHRFGTKLRLGRANAAPRR